MKVSSSQGGVKASIKRQTAGNTSPYLGYAPAFLSTSSCSFSLN
jgi:hypothetical protein